MKKTFKLQVENKKTERVVESIKNEIRKYIKREQRKALPEDKNYWFFDCKFAKGDETPVEIPLSHVIKSIDLAAADNCETFYLEIIARAEFRKEKQRVQSLDETTSEELETSEELNEEINEEDI
ncbi:DUF6172 family protein [Arcobacter sp. KX21116]|uniref:DUF6172 family protein n=1 Tax=Arcobacter iocasae TaxID=2906515 RepID=UPI0035D3F241